MSKPKLHMIGTTHFDPVWFWTWDEAMASIRATFRSALDRMEEEPDFIYSFSCPPVFEWIKKVDKAMFKEIKLKIKEGNWHLVEGWWLQPDCNTPSGESLVRQGLYGQRYLKENFGVMSKGAFNTDSFGHNLMLPQILKKSGIDYYVFGRPSEGEKSLPGPLFRWKSPDGSSVLAYRSGGEGANQYSFTVDKDAYAIKDQFDKYNHDLMMIYGVSNHGGAPTKRSIKQIHSLIKDEEKGFDVQFSDIDTFFKEQEDKILPLVVNELQVNFFGPFSDFSEIKINNRIGEYVLLNAEKASLLNKYIEGVTYPKEELSNSWKDLLFNQFHDILGGTCVKNAYFDARNLHGRVLQSGKELLNYSLQSIIKNINTDHKGFPLVVWNLNCFEVNTHIEGELQWAWEFEWYKGPLKITDFQGNIYKCQLIREKCVLPGFRSRFVFNADIPALGYKTFFIHLEDQPDELKIITKADDYRIENHRYRIDICHETGGIKELYNKVSNKVILRQSAVPTVLKDIGDTWAFDVKSYGDKLGNFKLVSSRLIENGPVRSVIRTKAEFNNSFIEQDIILYMDTDIIEGHFKVFWKEKNAVLKLKFDTVMNNPDLTAAIPYGHIKRSCDGKEMPFGEWIDLSEGNLGVSIISNSIFAYDAIDNSIGLTILRSPIYAHLAFQDTLHKEEENEYMEQGVREGSWRVDIHKGDWIQSQIPQKAILFNNPVITIDEGNHKGTLSCDNSYGQFQSKSSIVTVLKEAEDSEDIILRLYEYAGVKEEMHIKLEHLSYERSVEVNPFEIKTLLINKDDLKKSKRVNMLEL